MRKGLPYICLCFISLIIIMYGQHSKTMQAAELSLTPSHPTDELSPNPQCSGCHDGDTVMRRSIKSFDHTSGWYRLHQYSGAQANQLCQSCHTVSFCTDCHGHREELKPSTKHAHRPDRQFPHRGNYLLRHKIEGKINPVPCYRCHGRRNNKKCGGCHRNGQ
jgi:hypothetical protein